MDFVWEDPPERTYRDLGIWNRRLAPLKEHPNKWADFGPYTNSIASSIRKGKVKGVVAGEFDAVSRTKDGEDKPHLFVRYTGDVLSAP